MGCADYRLYCDGDSDSDANDLLYGVLDKKASWSYSKAHWLYFVGLPYLWVLTFCKLTLASSYEFVNELYGVTTVYILHLFHCESAGAHFILLYHNL